MVIRKAPLFTVLMALMLFAASGVVSVVSLTPDRDGLLREGFMRANGLSLDALCGIDQTNGDRPDHHCPLCHGLPDAPALAQTAAIVVFKPHDGWRQSADLCRQAQARNRNHSPRAPPGQA